MRLMCATVMGHVLLQTLATVMAHILELAVLIIVATELHLQLLQFVPRTEHVLGQTVVLVALVTLEHIVTSPSALERIQTKEMFAMVMVCVLPQMLVLALWSILEQSVMNLNASALTQQIHLFALEVVNVPVQIPAPVT